MKVVWSETAARELAEIHDALAAAASADVAIGVVERLLTHADGIAAFPEMGREVTDFQIPSIREVVEGPYRLVYEVAREENRIEMLAVFHARRLPPWLRDE